MIQYLNKEQIIRLNQATLYAHGGNFMPPHNFLHEENLDYLIEAVQAEMFGVPLYPTISDKAAIYCYNIICNHIFTDGNKRTGLAASLIFLNLNKYDISTKITNPILTDFIIKVASGQSSLAECRLWFSANTIITD
ncbi:type II toxin-antitoxin system death-on-curing family toxin [Arcicella sp. LKC2W]|uniref:type II toxin-antitoxin system death-on-curing family toxin n=1 Tax=Arcicella sp. LKC2W TaxID=2984198 RepID=UPI002B1F5362|nr:type II toxin-antitoxin system death-on-curing family toxin [Arcicella sp. LKC2W]MEA5458879.1 type II toxin-antitoxin system death-on-curing family toxin [Arcicella sp. LKC2W]